MALGVEFGGIAEIPRSLWLLIEIDMGHEFRVAGGALTVLQPDEREVGPLVVSMALSARFDFLCFHRGMVFWPGVAGHAKLVARSVID
jgi:hypothetical protein